MAFDHFGILAPLYDRIIKFNQADALIERLDLPVKARVLDAGGGTGRVAETLAGLAEHVIVADVSLGMLNQAWKRGIVAACCLAEQLPFPSQIFDRVLMVDAFHHVHGQATTARELWRVLAPMGRILVVEPDIHSLAVKGIALFEKLMLMRSHFLPAKTIAGLFEGLGATVQVEIEKDTAWIVAKKER